MTRHFTAQPGTDHYSSPSHHSSRSQHAGDLVSPVSLDGGAA